MRSWILTFILALVLGACSAAFASLADLSLDELLDIEVTVVSRRPQTLAESPAALTVIHGNELRAAGIHTLPDALRMTPGFQVGQVDANKSVVTSRGFAGLFANKLLVLVDGRSVYSPLFSGVFWESQDVWMEDVERIEVVRGPGATMWGANAVNGIVNVVTRHAAETHQTVTELGVGTQRRDLAVRHGGRFGDIDLRIYGQHFTHGRSVAATSLPVRDDWHMSRVGFRADGEPDADVQWSLIGNVRQGTVGQSVTFVASARPVAETRYFDADILTADLLARWRRSWGADDEIEAQVYYDLFDREEFVLQGRMHNFDIDVQQRSRRGRHHLVWGGGYRRTWDDFDGTFTMWLEPSRRTTQLFSGFLHSDVELIAERLFVSGGSKIEHNDYSGWEWQPNLRIWASPTPRVSAWAALSRAVRTPSRGDHDFRAAVGAVPADSLFAGAPAAVVTLFGSDRVASEKLHGMDAGVRTRIGNESLIEAAVYRYWYDDLAMQEVGLPFTLDEPGPPHLVLPLRGTSRSSATTTGAEISCEWAPPGLWQVRGTYTWMHLSVDVDPMTIAVSENPYEGDSPTHQLGLRAIARTQRWTLAIDGRWVDKLEAPGIPSYTSADVRLARDLGRGLEVSMNVSDALQSDHREAVSNSVGAVYTRVPRAAYVSLIWRH
jgi:iron complex outermembrane recepter protein